MRIRHEYCSDPVARSTLSRMSLRAALIETLEAHEPDERAHNLRCLCGNTYFPSGDPTQHLADKVLECVHAVMERSLDENKFAALHWMRNIAAELGEE